MACSCALLSSPVHTGSSSSRCASGSALSFHRVLRLLALGCGGATFAYASLEAGHAGTGRVRRPRGCLGFCLVTTGTSTAANGSRHEISPWNPPRQPCLRLIPGGGRRHHLCRAPSLVRR